MKQLFLFDNNNQQEPIYKKSTLWQLYVDGASRNNPGPSGAGIYIVKNGVPAEKHGFYLGNRTNNQAEYLALLLGLFFLKKQINNSDDFVEIVSDSQLLVRQLLGSYRVKNSELQALHIFAKHMLATIKHKIIHVLRDKNTIADKLANKGVNEKIGVPDEFKKILAAHHIMF